MVFQEVGDFLGVSDVAFDAQGQGFQALDEEPCVERADAGTEVAEGFGADTGYEAGTRDILGEVDTIVGFVRRSEFFETARASPVKFAVFNDEAAEGRAVAADEFRSRMDDDVSTVFERAEEERRSKGVVDDDRKAVVVCDFGDSFEVRNVDGRVAEAFEVNGFGLVVDVFGKGLRVVGIGEVRRNAEVFEGFAEQFDCAAVQGRSSDDFVTSTGEVDDGVGDSRSAAGCSQTGCAAFEGCDTFFQDVLRRVGQTAVDVASVFQSEAVFGLLCIFKDIRCGLVNRNGAGTRCRIRYLTCMLL